MAVHSRLLTSRYYKRTIVLALIFIVLGVLVKYGKMYFLIAGYNSMSKEEKSDYNIEGIATVFRNAMFGMALIILLGHLASRFLENNTIATAAFFIALLPGTAYLLIKSNSKKFKR